MCNIEEILIYCRYNSACNTLQNNSTIVDIIILIAADNTIMSYT